MDVDDLLGDEIDRAGNEDREADFEREIWLFGDSNE